MKKLYFLALLGFATLGFSQTTLLSENFGTTTTLPAGWTSTSTTAGWNANTASVSSGYTGASGGSNAVFAGTGTNGVTHTLTYSNLSTVGYNNINIIWYILIPENCMPFIIRRSIETPVFETGWNEKSDIYGSHRIAIPDICIGTIDFQWIATIECKKGCGVLIPCDGRCGTHREIGDDTS